MVLDHRHSQFCLSSINTSSMYAPCFTSCCSSHAALSPPLPPPPAPALLQLKPWQLSSMAGSRHPLDLPTSLLQSVADAAGMLQDGGLQGLRELLEEENEAGGPGNSSSSSSTPTVTAELFKAAVGGGGAVRALPLGALQQRICSSLAGVLEGELEEEDEGDEEEGAGAGEGEEEEGLPSGWCWGGEGRGGFGGGGWTDPSSAEKDTGECSWAWEVEWRGPAGFWAGSA